MHLELCVMRALSLVRVLGLFDEAQVKLVVLACQPAAVLLQHLNLSRDPST